MSARRAEPTVVAEISTELMSPIRSLSNVVKRIRTIEGGNLLVEDRPNFFRKAREELAGDERPSQASSDSIRDQRSNGMIASAAKPKASGSFISSAQEQDAYLADNRTYQTWRLMANMKELLVEVASQVLCRKYGPLDQPTCEALLNSFEARDFLLSGDIGEVAQKAADLPELPKDAAFARIFRMLHYVSQQFWEERKKQLLSTSRLRTLLLKREFATDFKNLVWQIDARVGLERPWKADGQTFLQSLPQLARGKSA